MPAHFDDKNLAAAAAGLVDWLQRQRQASGTGGVVFGLSGGVDSALLAALCRRALGDDCLALILPCYSSAADEADAQLVARQVGMPTATYSLDGIYDAMLTLLGTGTTGAPGTADATGADAGTMAMARANLKPRLRMAVLYYYANVRGWLVAGTTNRAESAIGYFTKFGDGAADIMPLAGLLKDEIWALSRYMGIPAKIVAKPPSAGLWPGQTDAAEMGMDYGELDAYLRSGIGAPAVASRIEALRSGSAHKRQGPPMGPTWAELVKAI